MKRYFLLWIEFFKMSLMADLEYRLNFVVKVLGEFFWYLAQLSVFEVLYLHTKTLNGWDINSMRVFMGTLFLVDVLYMILCYENMDYIGSLVRKGDLDLYLVKPVNSQFMVTCRKISVPYFLNFFAILIYLSWAISKLVVKVNFIQILAYLFLVISGFVILYSLRFMFSMIVVIFQDASNIQFVWHQLFRLATRPDIFYPRYLRILLLTILPVGFFASVPSRVLIEGISPAFLIFAPLFAILMLYASSKSWNWVLKKYASASS